MSHSLPRCLQDSQARRLSSSHSPLECPSLYLVSFYQNWIYLFFHLLKIYIQLFFVYCQNSYKNGTFEYRLSRFFTLWKLPSFPANALKSINLFIVYEYLYQLVEIFDCFFIMVKKCNHLSFVITVVIISMNFLNEFNGHNLLEPQTFLSLYYNFILYSMQMVLQFRWTGQ